MTLRESLGLEMQGLGLGYGFGEKVLVLKKVLYASLVSLRNKNILTVFV